MPQWTSMRPTNGDKRYFISQKSRSLFGYSSELARIPTNKTYGREFHYTRPLVKQIFRKCLDYWRLEQIPMHRIRMETLHCTGPLERARQIGDMKASKSLNLC